MSLHSNLSFMGKSEDFLYPRPRKGNGVRVLKENSPSSKALNSSWKGKEKPGGWAAPTPSHVLTLSQSLDQRQKVCDGLGAPQVSRLVGSPAISHPSIPRFEREKCFPTPAQFPRQL